MPHYGKLNSKSQKIRRGKVVALFGTAEILPLITAVKSQLKQLTITFSSDHIQRAEEQQETGLAELIILASYPNTVSEVQSLFNSSLIFPGSGMIIQVRTSSWYVTVPGIDEMERRMFDLTLPYYTINYDPTHPKVGEESLLKLLKRV
jgi:hypothetical protein